MRQCSTCPLIRFEGAIADNNRISSIKLVLCLSSTQWQPFCDLDRTVPGVTKFKFSMESELLSVLQAQYNFSSNLLFANDIWGAYVNGTWTGLIGDVYYGVRHTQSASTEIPKIVQSTKILEIRSRSVRPRADQRASSSGGLHQSHLHG